MALRARAGAVVSVTDIVAIVLGIAMILALVAILYLAIKYVAAQGTIGAVRDLYEKQREATIETERDRDGFKEQLDTANARAKQLQDRLSVTESERNAAYQQGADHVVERVKALPIEGAAKLVTDLLAAPLPGFVPHVPAVPDVAAKAAADAARAVAGLPPAADPRAAAAGGRIP